MKLTEVKENAGISKQGSHSTGKTGKMVKSNSRQGKHREFKNFGKHRENIGKTQGKHREFENFHIECTHKESMRRKNYCVASMVLLLLFKMLLFYYENSQAKINYTGKSQGKYREFCFMR